MEGITLVNCAYNDCTIDTACAIQEPVNNARLLDTFGSHHVRKPKLPLTRARTRMAKGTAWGGIALPPRHALHGFAAASTKAT